MNVLGPKNTIVDGLIKKILEKWKKGSPFCVYIIIPMHVSHPPGTLPFGCIMAHQASTLNYLYSRLSKEMGAADVNRYLGVYCLAKVEWISPHLIYVHSKLLIVDDK